MKSTDEQIKELEERIKNLEDEIPRKADKNHSHPRYIPPSERRM